VAASFLTRPGGVRGEGSPIVPLIVPARWANRQGARPDGRSPAAPTGPGRKIFFEK